MHIGWTFEDVDFSDLDSELPLISLLNEVAFFTSSSLTVTYEERLRALRWFESRLLGVDAGIPADDRE